MHVFIMSYLVIDARYGHSGKLYIGTIIVKLFIKDVVMSPCIFQ